MSSLSAEHRNRRIFIKRLRVLMIGALVLLFLLLGRIAQWTAFSHQHYQVLARNNFVHPQRLYAPRGRIFSRDGRPLAVNRLSYSVWISPFKVTKSELHETVIFLEDVLGRDFSDKEEETLALRPRWRRKLLARNLSLESVTPILERQWNLPGLRVTSNFQRYYPAGTECAHVVGYLGRISRKNMEKYLAKGYARDDLIGIAGIERRYEDLLYGVPGREIVQRDARGRFCKTLETEPATPGEDLYLTLDLDFQRFAEFKLDRRNGVIIVMNPRNGEVYVMVSYPGYDSNNPAAPSKPSRPVSYLNKTIQEYFLPASTFKLVTAMAGTRVGIEPEEKFLCEGYYYLPNWKHPYKCDYTSGHGRLDLMSALQYSCNIYFYKSALRIGAPGLLQQALDFSYGARTGIDLPFEAPGKIPLQSADSMTPGNLLHLSIGQGGISATPLQVLYSYCIFAGGGTVGNPHLLDFRKDPERRKLEHTPLSRKVWIAREQRRAVMKGLAAVVNSPGGTAYKADFPREWKVAGKTGTAEREGKEDDAWFVCFAPNDDPEVAVLVLLEEAGFGGAVAAPLAREILEYYFLNRSRFNE